MDHFYGAFMVLCFS